MDDEGRTSVPSSPIHRLAFIMKHLCLLALVLLIPWTSYAQDTLTVAAQHKFAEGKYGAAATLLESGLAKSSRQGTWAFWLARCYMELGNLDRALDYAQRAVTSDPDNSEYHHWLGKAYGLQADKKRSFGLARKSRKEFEEAVNLDNANLSARRDLMEFYLKAPRILGGGKHKAWQQALAIFQLDRIQGLLACGFYWESLKDPHRADADYAKVIELKPAHAAPYFEVAEFHERQENASSMQTVLKAAAGMETQDARWSYYRAVADILAHKKLPEAERELRAYLASPPRLDFPSHASAREWLGRAYEESGRPELAIQEYQAALKLDPDRKTLVEALKRLGKIK